MSSEPMPQEPTVAIVGRPNVGKSSLFNRLLRRRQAIVDRVPGVTRDRLVARLVWRDRACRIVDTGGLTFDRRASLADAIQHQVRSAIDEADLLCFVCDAVTGSVPLDAQIAETLRISGKPIVLVVNKADTESIAERAVEFHALGLGTPIPVSSAHGRGIGDLLDELLAHLPATAASASAQGSDSAAVSLAIVGRPNVGKSSFVNRLAGTTRMTVDSAPGTTRDAVAVPVTRGARRLEVVDTAGIRARARLNTLVEIVSVTRAMEAAARADGCLMMIDVSVGLRADDLKVLGKILQAGCPCVIVMNKWDLIDAGDPQQYAQALWRRAAFAAFVPIIATSTTTGYHVEDALRQAIAVAERGRTPIPVEALKRTVRVLREAPSVPGRLRRVRIDAVRQVFQHPLTVELTIHGRVPMLRSDLAFVERTLRRHAELEGVPVQCRVRSV